jgi:hypothetical protein
MRNQCDGCRRGLPVKDGLHYEPSTGQSVIGCTKDRYDIAGRVIEYEMGTLSDDEEIVLFQDLVDSGVAWQLQGSYGRAAVALRDAGLITFPRGVVI